MYFVNCYMQVYDYMRLCENQPFNEERALRCIENQYKAPLEG